jgi:hypothetical protein
VALSIPALAYSIDGGTLEQRNYANEVIQSFAIPAADIESGLGREVEILIEEHHDPYWEHVECYEASAAGLASYGQIWIAASYTPGYETFFGEIITHEWCHQVWFALSSEARAEYTALCTEGYVWDPEDWYSIPAEAWAENLKIALVDHQYLKYDYPRTKLRTFGAEWMLEFVREHLNPPIADPPFSDLAGADFELFAAARWAKDAGLVWGYPDGTLHPWEGLTKRHVALIASRMEFVPPDWPDDYSPATRADVRDVLSSLAQWFDSERWDETLTRSQLVRLLYRAYGPC